VENMSEVVPPKVGGGPPQVAVRLDWSDAAAVEPQHIDQLIVQLGLPTVDGIPDGIYVSVGTVPPPLVVVTDEESLRQATETLQGGLKVHVHGRFHMSRGLLGAIIKALQTTADQYDAAASTAEARKAQEQG
jgi:hypothetical protein